MSCDNHRIGGDSDSRRGTLPPVITIDGPSGVGKGTIGRLLAERLGWRVLDSGALYRLLAVAGRRQGISLDDEDALCRLSQGLDCEFLSGDDGERVLLSGREVTGEIRTETAGNDASRLAGLPGVREALVARQRHFRGFPGLVADGRDMGTAIFPDAEVKIFLTASPHERANRRHKQLKAQGADVNLASLLTEIGERDRRDRERAASPLEPAGDAVLIDTTDMSAGAVLDCVMGIAEARGVVEERGRIVVQSGNVNTNVTT